MKKYAVRTFIKGPIRDTYNKNTILDSKIYTNLR